MTNKAIPENTPNNAPGLLKTLGRIADALDRLAPPPKPEPDLFAADAFVWHAEGARLEPVPKVSRVDIALLKGVENQRQTLYENSRRFMNGLPANNALLWGARGTGKSSLVKAVHAALNEEIANNNENDHSLALVEIHREDIPSLPDLLHIINKSKRRCIIYCDDLSFDADDASYKSLKAVLDGGIEGRPDNVVFYATSNRRHLLSRDMIENESSTAIHAGEAVEEKVSLSDRFGLWLGFHNIDQATFMDIVEGYAAAFGLDMEPQQLRKEAQEWQVTRGSRSGRVAWQFIQELAGRLGKKLG